MRKKIVAGNWKMNLKRTESIALVDEILSKLPNNSIAEIIFAPSFVHLYKVAKMCVSIDKVSVAAQDCSAKNNGSFTGEVSASMISSCNIDYVLLGHSERRVNFNETNQNLKEKVDQAFYNNLKIIFCCGENLLQRDTGIHFDWIKGQISDSLFHLSEDDFKKIVIAYEPIWAIGTGITASTNQAQEMHVFIRNLIKSKYGNKIADNISLLYGGSCNSSNSMELFAQDDIDGGLIGGASLKAKDFLEIIRSF